MNAQFPVDVHKELARGERPSHTTALFSLFAAIALFVLAAVYGSALIGSIGARLALAIIVDNAFVIGVCLAAAVAILALKWLRFIRFPFRFTWAAGVALIALVLAVAFSPLEGPDMDPASRATAPVERLMRSANAAYARNVQMPALDEQRRGERPVDSDRPLAELPPVPTEAPPPAKPSGHVSAPEDGAFEWAWADAEGTLHVTSTPPPEGARVISKAKKR